MLFSSSHSYILGISDLSDNLIDLRTSNILTCRKYFAPDVK